MAYFNIMLISDLARDRSLVLWSTLAPSCATGQTCVTRCEIKIFLQIIFYNIYTVLKSDFCWNQTY